MLLDGDPCELEMFSFECVSFEGDATNQEAVQKEKVYMGKATILNITKDDIMDVSDDADAIGVCPTVTASLCDLQTVLLGTTSELRGILFKQFWGIGQNTWCERATTEPLPGTFTIFEFALDKGGET